MHFILGFFGRLISRFFLIKGSGWLFGLLKVAGIYTVFLGAVYLAVTKFIAYFDSTVLEMVRNMSPVGQSTLTGIAACLPSNLPFLISLVTGYYLVSLAFHFGIEFIKLRNKFIAKLLGGSIKL